MKRKSVLGIAAIVMLTLMLGGCGSGKETLPGTVTLKEYLL